MTKIFIEFEKRIGKKRLGQLMGELAAVCSEDRLGKAWSKSGCNIESDRDEYSEEHYKYVAAILTERKPNELIEMIMDLAPNSFFNSFSPNVTAKTRPLDRDSLEVFVCTECGHRMPVAEFEIETSEDGKVAECEGCCEPTAVLQKEDERRVGGFGITDVKLHAKDVGVKLTYNQIEEVFAEMEHRFDASMGMDWHTIEFHIWEVKKKKK